MIAGATSPGVPRKIYLNKPQRLSFLIRAKEEYHVWGRGTGKTEGPIALRSIHNANLMPRGATGIVAATYMQILTRTLPPLEKAWQRYGYMPGIHYWIAEYPNKKLKLPRAIYHPRDAKYSIFWWNGHVMHLMSLDRPGLANGKTVDSIFGDEARFLNYPRYLDDIAPTNRGNRDIFGHLAEHHSITFCTDMPHDQGGKWILDKAKEVNKKLITEILNIQIAYNNIEVEYNMPGIAPARKIYLARKLRDYAKTLNELRKGSIYYSEATSLDNIEILGEEQFSQWKRELKTNVYDRAILNKRIIQVDKGFYPLLNLDKHTYDAFDYSYLDNVGLYMAKNFTQDSRCDADVNRKKPIDIAFDAAGHFNCMVVGQESPKEYRILNALFVKDEQRLEELCTKYCDYYQHHTCREVYFYYDHTFVGTDATRVFSLADLITKKLTARGWKVNRYHIGQQPRHDTRYRMWGVVLKEDDPRVKPVRLNKTNCAQLLVALQRAAVRQGTKGYEKDKRDEARIHTVPAEEATHFTDAFDTLYIGKYKHQIGYTMPVADLITI